MASNPPNKNDDGQSDAAPEISGDEGESVVGSTELSVDKTQDTNEGQVAAKSTEQQPKQTLGTQSIFAKPPRTTTYRALRILGLFIIIIAVIVAVGSFWVMTGASTIEPTPQVWTGIWVTNGILVVLVVALVFTEIVVMIQARMRRHSGARLRSRLVGLFAMVATLPALLIAVFAALTLNQGLDQWFSERTRDIVENSRLIARSYLLEHAQVLRDDIIWVATELETARETFETDRERFQRVLTALATTRSLPFAQLLSGDGDVLLRAQINVQGPEPSFPLAVIKEAQEGVPTLLTPGTTNMVGAIVKLRGYDDTFVFVARPVDQAVIEYMKLTDQNISEYRLYASNRVVFQITYGIMYLGLALVLLLAALWIGMALANRFVDPIRNLMIASSRVAKGRLDTQVPIVENSGDLRDLGVSFNSMINQLASQRRELLDANDTNELRRQFTEAVVEGVSAGVVGLDADGAITLVNRRSCDIFGADELDLMGLEISHVVPELSSIIERAKSSRHGQIRDQINLGTEAEQRTYQVQLTREGTITESKGFVVTLDDITDLVSAQRTSAWADVARRIAHEIKNPLTPIQLSAERLRKRYAKKLEGDFEVFDKCTSTIIRQVGDIGRMVDEFSSFARMPSAILERADLSDTIRQAVFLESVRLPQIEIEADLPLETIYAHFDVRLISQALTNLIKNAVEALENVGIQNIDGPKIIIKTSMQDNFVTVDICDNGRGWPQDNRLRLLEPYMTTREKGTGLGLAIVAKIIEQHGGNVELLDAGDALGTSAEKEGSRGACFRFTLPLQSLDEQSDNVEQNKTDQDKTKTEKPETEELASKQPDLMIKENSSSKNKNSSRKISSE
ncbi:hypothetical protein MNBD_ALPHA11-1360 [hydrothermal vent metagenome]|uniref:histidine kinase n=1 Tax=hydrothermal vent metagenome TaxID=652676 RepID=A0A3B0UFD0_9ZZZZ